MTNARRERLAHRARLQTYNLSEEGFSEMVLRSGNRCKICGSGERLHIDHDHGSGAVRGLLCSNCNHGLGNFKNDQSCLMAAVEYLRKHQP